MAHILWVIAAGILLLLCALLFLPCALDVHYENKEWIVFLRLLGFRIRLDKKPNQSRQTQTENALREKCEEKRTLREKTKAALLGRLLSPGYLALRKMLGHIQILDMHIVLVAGGEEPDVIGRKAGNLWAGLGVALSAGRSLFRRFEVSELSVLPDFVGEYGGKERISGVLRVRAAVLIWAGLGFLRCYLKERKALQKRRVSRAAA